MQQRTPESLPLLHTKYTKQLVYFSSITVSKYLFILFKTNKHACQEVEPYWFQEESANVLKRKFFEQCRLNYDVVPDFVNLANEKSYSYEKQFLWRITQYGLIVCLS